MVILPTARLETPTSEPPTPTNTRLPTVTPRPTKTPVPPEALILPSTEVPTLTPTTGVTNTPAALPTSAPRFYQLSFEAGKSILDRGDCITLTWQSGGPITLWLKNESVESADKLCVCPR